MLFDRLRLIMMEGNWQKSGASTIHFMRTMMGGHKDYGCLWHRMGMVDDHEAGKYGLFDSSANKTSSKSKSSAKWQHKCTYCGSQAVRKIAGPNANNPDRAYYNCSDPQELFFHKIFSLGNWIFSPCLLIICAHVSN